MKFLQQNKKEIEKRLDNCPYRELLIFSKYIESVLESDLSIKQFNSVTRPLLVNRLIIFLSTPLLVEKIYHKLAVTSASKYLYENLVWDRNSVETQEVERKFGVTFLSEKANRLDSITKQKDEFCFIQREEKDHDNYKSDYLSLRGNFKSILKMVIPVPAEIELLPITDEEMLRSHFTYSNEENIFNFINAISDMLKNNLVEFGKTNEKPLAKTLTILKNTTQIKEFYEDKKFSSLACDMLTRSFSYYYWQTKRFKGKEIDVLKDFVNMQFADKMNFFITRVFLSHLRKVRYDGLYSGQSSLFETLKLILCDLPKDAWVDMNNIIKFCKYKDIRVDIEQTYKTGNYYLDGEIIIDGKIEKETFYADDIYYNAIFLEPILKASFFYLGTLGLFELKYDEPYSSYTIRAKGKKYISTWDSLEFVKFTKLGAYIFDYSDAYEQKAIAKKATTLKFDEYKPIITVDEKDTLSLAKLDTYCDKYDKNRYILSYSKIFKDCKNTKALELKIEHFYKNIESHPPKVFKNFFDEIKQNRNALKRDLKQVVIELDNNKKLLQLFMENKKLQELIIKAQGFRVLVLKENIPKLTKIVKENGFFVEF